LPGGDAAVRHPWRMAMSYLRDAFGEGYTDLDLALLRRVPKQRRSVVDAMLARNLNCVDTSSCGRLFDAVSSIVGLRNEVSFEGQAAIELEMISDPRIERVYPYAIGDGDVAQLDLRPMIEAIVRDLARGTPTSEIAAAFHNTLATVIVEMCRKIRQREALNRVCLSGGTFQNMLLLHRTVSGLRKSGFEVYLHAKVPPNDGGIALGQAVIATAVLSSSYRPNN
jgi:hydrogenase maturation protein HypF